MIGYDSEGKGEQLAGGVFNPHTLGLHRRTLFAMVIQGIDCNLSRLKQGFDSPRERQLRISLRILRPSASDDDRLTGRR